MDSQRLEELLANESFMRWIQGAYSAEEKAHWDAWVQEDPDHEILAEEVKQLTKALRGEHEVPNANAELNRLHQLIDERSQAGSASNPQFVHRYSGKAVGSIAAGILVLVVVLGSIFAYNSYPQWAEQPAENPEAEAKAPVKEYRTNYGEKLTFRLSDGSRMVLNANSQLKFSSKIQKGLNTEVWLKGEAYFDITHLEGDQQRTFTVHTNNGSIQVLGTRFVVNTFAGQTQTVLKDGKIRVRVKDESSHSQAEYLLEPGEMAQFKAFDNKIAIKEVNTRIYTSWTQDKMIFDNTPMEEVATRIEHTFGVQVIVDEAYAKETLSGSIKSGNLEVVVKALEKILKTEVEKNGKKLLIGKKKK